MPGAGIHLKFTGYGKMACRPNFLSQSCPIECQFFGLNSILGCMVKILQFFLY